MVVSFTITSYTDVVKGLEYKPVYVNVCVKNTGDTDGSVELRILDSNRNVVYSLTKYITAGAEECINASIGLPSRGVYTYYIDAFNTTTNTVDDEKTFTVKSYGYRIEFNYGYTQTGPFAGVSVSPQQDDYETMGCYDAGYMTYTVYYMNQPNSITVTVSSDYGFVYARLFDAHANHVACIYVNPFTLTSDVVQRMNDGMVSIYVLDATVTVNIKQSNGGTTDPPPGSYTIKRGMSTAWRCDVGEPGNPCRIKLTVKAIPAEGYTFRYWIVGDQILYDNPLTLDPPCQNMTLDVTPVFMSTSTQPTPTPTSTTSSQLILIGLALLAFVSLTKKYKQRLNGDGFGRPRLYA